MFKKYVAHWYEWALYIAAVVATITFIGHWNLTQLTILAGLTLIHLHFYEEMGFPGGFPWMGVYAEFKDDVRDGHQLVLNKANTLWGNEWFAAVVYLGALFFPQWHWLTLAVVIFAFLEFVMHLFYFNVAIKFWYNPGLITAILLTVVSVNYMVKANMSMYTWVDWVVAIAWIGFNYWMGFRGPVYKYFGTFKSTSFSDEEMAKAKWMWNKIDQQ